MTPAEATYPDLRVADSDAPLDLPTQFDLPCEDGAVENLFDLPQSSLLTDSGWPVFCRLHPDNKFCLSHDTGIYWSFAERHARAIVPDWCYVPNVPKIVKGEVRRSFVMWDEVIEPEIVLEYVSGNGSEERDRTPETGKYWIYQHGIRPSYYGIYERDPGRLEVHQRIGSRFVLMTPNERGRYPIASLGIELGIWTGDYQGLTLPWLRWFEADGRLLPTSDERADQEGHHAEQERQLKDKYAAKLRELGVNPDQL